MRHKLIRLVVPAFHFRTDHWPLLILYSFLVSAYTALALLENPRERSKVTATDASEADCGGNCNANQGAAHKSHRETLKDLKKQNDNFF